jgi:integrase/recombinase XerD
MFTHSTLVVSRIPDSRNLYRKHERGCNHYKKGKRRDFTKCECTIWVDFSSGTRTDRSLRTRDWQRAEDILRKWRENVSPACPGMQPGPPLVVGPPSCTVERACSDFLEDARSRGLRPTTRYKYELLFRRLQVFSEDRALRLIESVTLEELRQFRASLMYGNTAAQKRVEELRTFFGFCKQSGWISDNPAKKLKYPKVTKPPRQPFSEQEVAKIRSAYSQYEQLYGRSGGAHAVRLIAFVELLLYSGLRIGDAVQLRRDSISEGKLLIRTQKTGTDVTLLLPKSVLERLQSVKCESEDYFFWSGTSKLKSAVGDWQRSLKRFFRFAGVAGHAHRFRHTFAKRLLMKGATPEQVAMLLGHSDSSIVLKHYSNWVKERQDQLEERVARAWDEIDRPEIIPQTPKPPEPAIQPLYGNQSKWSN